MSSGKTKTYNHEIKSKSFHILTIFFKKLTFLFFFFLASSSSCGGWGLPEDISFFARFFFWSDSSFTFLFVGCPDVRVPHVLLPTLVVPFFFFFFGGSTSLSSFSLSLELDPVSVSFFDPSSSLVSESSSLMNSLSSSVSSSSLSDSETIGSSFWGFFFPCPTIKFKIVNIVF